jgi:hypothetical protein
MFSLKEASAFSLEDGGTNVAADLIVHRIPEHGGNCEQYD